MALLDGKAKCRMTGTSCGDTCFNENTIVGRLAGDNKKLLVVMKMKKASRNCKHWILQAGADKMEFSNELCA